MKYKVVALTVLVMMSQLALAGPGRSGYVSLENKKIQLIQGGMSRLYIYDVDMRLGGDTTCTIKTTPVLLFSSGDIVKEMYSAILMAKASGKKVDFIAGGCVEISGNTYSSISALYVE